MTGRTPSQAVHNFTGPIQRALSCVSDAIVYVGGGYHTQPATDPPHVLTIKPDPIPLAGAIPLDLSIVQQYRIARTDQPGRERWHVQTVGYFYVITDAAGAEVFAYHWHPAGNSPISSPHLHLKKGARLGRPELLKAHFPTGRLGIQEILQFLLRDLQVSPRRVDWQHALAESLRQSQAADTSP